MKKSSIAWIVVGVVAFLLVLLTIGAYNNFVSLDQNVNSKWSEVENQYQRQADLIPNLVSVISSSVKVETDFVKDVTAARTGWTNAKTLEEKDKAGVEMNSQVSTFITAVAESYPTLQANKQYTALTDELAGTQNRITTARGRYIEAIQRFNTATKRFPSNVFARIFGFEQKEYYQAKEGSLETPVLGDGVLP